MDVSGIAISAFTMEEEASISSPCKRDFFPSLLFLFVFHSIPAGWLCSSALHTGFNLLGKSKEKGSRAVWELVRARLRALQGRREPCLPMTSGRCGADPHGTSNGFHHWGAADDIAVGRVSEPRFNKPSAAPGPIPRKLVNAVSCQGSVHLRQGESAATPQPCGCQGRSSIH